MKVLYKGKVYDTKELNGMIVSLDGKILFGKVGEPLMCGEEVVEEVEQDGEEEISQV